MHRAAVRCVVPELRGLSDARRVHLSEQRRAVQYRTEGWFLNSLMTFPFVYGAWMHTNVPRTVAVAMTGASAGCLVATRLFHDGANALQAAEHHANDSASRNRASSSK